MVLSCIVGSTFQFLSLAQVYLAFSKRAKTARLALSCIVGSTFKFLSLAEVYLTAIIVCPFYPGSHFSFSTTKQTRVTQIANGGNCITVAFTTKVELMERPKQVR
jgi:hypothetical protein